MPTYFKDGPAADVHLMLKRAPFFLRVVYNDRTQKYDALDLLQDTPEPHESIYAYKVVTQPTWCHIRATKGGGFFTTAEYEYMQAQPEDALMRDPREWQAWCQRKAHLMPKGWRLISVAGRLTTTTEML